MDVSNASTESGIAEDATQSTMDSSTTVAASSSTINMNSDSSRWEYGRLFFDIFSFVSVPHFENARTQDYYLLMIYIFVFPFTDFVVCNSSQTRTVTMVQWHGSALNVMCATWNFPMEPICEGIKCDTPELNRMYNLLIWMGMTAIWSRRLTVLHIWIWLGMNAVCAKSDSFARIILLNILQRTQKHFRIIVRFVIVAFNGKSQCEPISKMNMSAKMISSKPVHCAIIERAPWNHCAFTFSIGMASTSIIPVQMHHHHCYSLLTLQMPVAICRQLR